MYRITKYSMLFISILLCFSCNTPKNQGPVKVTLEKNNIGQYRLFVNNNEFFVKGAGLEFGNIRALAENGGNSFRTWRSENGEQDAIEILDQAQKYNLKVLMGLEVGRERHGYSYDDTAFVNKQYNYLKSEVERLKNHPALLGWAIGNELNLGQNDLRIYDEVNRLSKMIHSIDPNHLTTTTTAGIGQREADYIKTHCTDIDFLSIQMYGDIENLQKRIADAGWTAPYMVTEWGATGHWEVSRTRWNVPIEQTSHEKAVAFLNRYNTAINADPINCLGSYVFLWGQKQERTPTWYGMFLENGAKTETVDMMCKIWTGYWPNDRCPEVDSLKLNNKKAAENIFIQKDQKFAAEVFFINHDTDSLTFTWEIIPESTDLGLGGDFETRPESIFKANLDSKAEFQLADTGAYRLFVYVTDTAGNAGTANIPFYITE